MVKPRCPVPTLKFVDSYCEFYQNIFPEVRSYECFKYLHIGIISEIKRKTLPAIAKVVGLENEQSLHHFLANSPWEAKQLRKRRLEIILRVLQGRSIILIVDDTGDKKQGKKTDYVKRQYIGNLGKIENGIVAVTVYGYCEGITFPLIFKVFKPKERLKKEDKYQTKPELAACMIRELISMGFKIEMVLADSLYGESGANFLDVLYQLKLHFVIAIRSNHGVWLPSGQIVRYNKWRKFERVFSNGEKEIRYIREIIFGQQRLEQFWLITTDPETLPANSTWYLMSYVPGIKYSEVGNFYGLRTWVEYGLKQSRGMRPAACEPEVVPARSAGKNELGWADFRVTNYAQIEKWWEIIMSAYLMVSLHYENFNQSLKPIREDFQSHRWWNREKGWKNLLNNLRLIVQPFVYFKKFFQFPNFLLDFQDLSPS